MPTETSQDEYGEKLRLCPTCRMRISVLATKCRYCGEPVGRPKDENRRLTVDDLGGQSTTTYAIGGEVLDAIEAFRQEELTALTRKEESPRRWYQFWRGKERPVEAKPLLEAATALEDRKIEVSQFAGSSSRRSSMVRHQSGFGRRVAWTAVILVGLVVLSFVGMAAKGWIAGYLAGRNAKPVISVDNPAVAILNRNGPAIDALRAAVGAVSQNDSTENRQVLDRAREQVRKEVNALLNAVPWNRTMLDEASNLVSQSLDADPASAALKDLREEVTRELVIYKMSIVSLDAGARQVVLRITYPGQQPENIVYREGGKVKNRFDVKRISEDGVTFEDPLRKSSGGLPRRFKLSVDGGISML